MKYRIVALLAALLAFPAAAPAGAPVELTAILPLTGNGALIGVSQQQGLQALEKYVNESGGIGGRPLHLVYLDNTSSPQVEVQLFNGVAAKGAQVVLGGAFSAMCKAVVPIAQEKGPVTYCLSPATRPPRGGMVFSGNIHPVDLSDASLRYFQKRNWLNVALLISTDASGQEVEGSVDQLLAKYPKLHVVAHERFNPADTSISATITKINAAHPQALLIWSGTGIPTALQGLHDTGSTIPVATSNSLMLYSAMQQFGTILPKDLFFAAPRWAAYPSVGSGPVRDALDAYFKTFRAMNVKPDMGQDTAWDPGLIVVQALRALGPDAKAAQIRDYIERLHGFAGVNGYYDFRVGDQRGLNPNDTSISMWNPAKNTWVAAP